MPTIADVSFGQTFHESLSDVSMESTLSANGEFLEAEFPSLQNRDPESSEATMASSSATSSHGAAPQPSDMAMDSTAETSAPSLTFPSYEMPDVHEESSMDDTLPENVSATDGTLTYEIVDSASQRSREMLVDNRGYSYTVKRRNNAGVTWRCTVRNKKVKCGATVSQRGGQFIFGRQPHLHAPSHGIKHVAKVNAGIKEKASANVFTSASTIVDEVLLDKLNPGTVVAALAKHQSLIRTVNRRREKNRPKHPQNLDFDLVVEHLPDNFLQDDVRIDGQRHLIFASRHMLELLFKAKTWYMDGTFRVIRAPFQQLFSIHAFLKKDGELKQVPLLFVVMSSRRKKDYKAVLMSVLNMLPQDPRCECAFFDYEIALWKAIASVLPDVERKGCVYHWANSIMKKVKSLGLQSAYRHDKATQKFCRRKTIPPIPHFINE